MPRNASPSDRLLVLATGNRAKGRELAELLADLPYRIRDLSAYPGVLLPPEGETSYAENALGKARAVTAATGEMALADDSGIEVDAFGGRPGVLSARYGGEGLTDPERNGLMLRELAAVPPARRTARYRAVIAVTGPDGREATVEGTVDGVLLDAPRGTGGFGYDPVFYYAPLGATFAEITPEAKHAVSHRGRAMVLARELLRRWS
ncbi:MAG TPA: non-canonical purine NTP pyrophosphatase [Methylomirabilota bacterium]